MLNYKTLNSIDFENNLLDISILLLFICFILYARGYFKFDLANKVFVIYMAFCFLLQLAFKITFRLNIDNWFISNIFLIGEFYIISYFYYLIVLQKLPRSIIKSNVVVFSLIIIIQYIYDYTVFFRINILQSLLVSIAMITYSAFYFYEILNQKKPYYYILIGTFIYQFGSIFIFLAANFFLSNYGNFCASIYNIHTFLTIIYSFFVLFEWKKNFSKIRK
jgi:hypothetical protein